MLLHHQKQIIMVEEGFLTCLSLSSMAVNLEGMLSLGKPDPLNPA